MKQESIYNKAVDFRPYSKGINKYSDKELVFMVEGRTLIRSVEIIAFSELECKYFTHPYFNIFDPFGLTQKRIKVSFEKISESIE